MKIGIIQVQRFGDLLIALPIAAWYIERGHEVYWPVHQDFYAAIQQAAPQVNFISLDPAIGTSILHFLYEHPMAVLQALGCEKIIPLAIAIEGADFIDLKLVGSLKFDEYKYARAGVPFSEKWRLGDFLERDLGREKALHAMLGITGPYICVHPTASNINMTVNLPERWLTDYQIVKIHPLTDNQLDWIYTLEHAAKLVLLDSCFANLAEQLNIGGDKYLITRSVVAATPVFKNGWTFCWPFDPIVEKESV